MANIEALIQQNNRRRGSASTCEDKNAYCPYWASAGYCKHDYVYWMETNCPRSCGKCGCSDQYSQCDTWGSYGFCTRYYVGFMETYCRKACKLCYSCKCGQANHGDHIHRTGNRIVGGVDVAKNEWPWQVELLDQNSKTICGGTIISKKEILTAASCTNGILASNIRVLVGDHDHDNDHDHEHDDDDHDDDLDDDHDGDHDDDHDDDENDDHDQVDDKKDFKVCSKKEHESYSSTTLDYDIAILYLCDEIDFTEDVSPACLPESSGQDPGLNEGVNTVVTGWGALSDGGNYPYVLQEITMKTMTNAVCATEMAGLSGPTLTDRMLCSQADGKSICKGDTGGPWITRAGSNWILTGVSSWTPEDATTGAQCIPGVPSVAARVSNLLAWIKTNMPSATCPRA